MLMCHEVPPQRLDILPDSQAVSSSYPSSVSWRASTSRCRQGILTRLLAFSQFAKLLMTGIDTCEITKARLVPAQNPIWAWVTYRALTSFMAD